MKAIIILDNVPDWQTGEEVQVFFPDSMCKKGKCIAVLDDDLGQLYSTDAINAKIIYRYLLDDYLKGRFDDDTRTDCFMIGKRVKVNSPGSRFDGEIGTIERVYYAIRMDSLAKKKEENPNFKGSTIYNIVSSNVEVDG